MDDPAGPTPWRLDDQAAAFYEQHFVPAIFAQWAPLVANAAHLARGQRVLDVGCGPGTLTLEAARRVAPDGHVTGLDLNASMLAQARSKDSSVEWREGDVADLPFDDASFDAVLCQAALMFFPDRVGALREMRRVLLPGGALVVHVFGESAGYEATAELLEQHAGKEVAEIFRAPFALRDVRTVTALVAEAGFGTVERETHALPARFPSMEQFLRTEIDGWVLRGRVDVDALLGPARERLGEWVRDDGAVCIPMDGHIVSAWMES